ncbi:MAG: hypothetical protein SX243_22900 [Acidobacteriota bacterium]|nr:hypothetical protein [Acidobacteriota bacterium]
MDSKEIFKYEGMEFEIRTWQTNNGYSVAGFFDDKLVTKTFQVTQDASADFRGQGHGKALEQVRVTVGSDIKTWVRKNK